MDKKIQYILTTWHKHFEDDDNQYSEFEHSDIEYFVGCMLYNHFAFEYALDTMKTIDLSYDFLQNCGDMYEEFLEIVSSVNFDSEAKKIEFLQDFLAGAISKYSEDELYLLNRLNKHLEGVKERYESGKKAARVEFAAPSVKKVKNPLESL